MNTHARRSRAIEALASVDRLCRAAANSLRWLAAPCAFFVVATTAFGQEPANPLKPLDLSSPRATLTTFLDSADALATFLTRDYLASPSRALFPRLISLGAVPVQCLDLSEVPPRLG